jgi:hypothetical protein
MLDCRAPVSDPLASARKRYGFAERCGQMLSTSPGERCGQMLSTSPGERCGQMLSTSLDKSYGLMWAISPNKGYGLMWAISPNKGYGLMWAITLRGCILLHGIFHVRADGALSPRQAAVPGGLADPATHIPPMPYFLYPVDDQLHWGALPCPVGADGAPRLVDDAHPLVDALRPEVRISTSGLIVVNGKSASTPNEKSTSIQESFQFLRETRAILQAKAQPLCIRSFGLRHSPCALTSPRGPPLAPQSPMQRLIPKCRDVPNQAVVGTS